MKQETNSAAIQQGSMNERGPAGSQCVDGPSAFWGWGEVMENIINWIIFIELLQTGWALWSCSML